MTKQFPDTQKAMIEFNNYAAFKVAAAKGYIPILELIFNAEQSDVNLQKALVKVESYAIMRHFIDSGFKDSIQKILKIFNFKYKALNTESEDLKKEIITSITVANKDLHGIVVLLGSDKGYDWGKVGVQYKDIMNPNLVGVKDLQDLLSFAKTCKDPMGKSSFALSQSSDSAGKKFTFLSSKLKAKIVGFLFGTEDSAIDPVIKSVQALNTSLNKGLTKPTDDSNKLASEYAGQNDEALKVSDSQVSLEKEVNTIVMGESSDHHDA
jgi:hypothetical protein